MQKGLKGLFNPEKKFEAEASYGKKILYVAWSVEILAAIIGLTIAWATAYDAYSKETNPDQGTLINAIIGALPFLVIAVIEPTKIPLAGGFYKTRILGWKLLILAALMALTLVTFETMFNGLERQLTNVTKEVVEADNNINSLNDQIKDRELKLNEINNISIDDEVKDLQKQLDTLNNSYNNDVDQLNKTFDNQVEALVNQKNIMLRELDSLSSSSKNSSDAQIEIIQNEIDRLNNEKAALRSQKKDAIKQYKDSVDTNNNTDRSNIDQQISRIDDQKANLIEERNSLSEANDNISSELNNIILPKLQKDLDETISDIEKQRNERLDGVVFGKGKINEEFDARVDQARNNYNTEKRRLISDTENRKSTNDNRILEINNQIDALTLQGENLLNDSPEIQNYDTDEISKIENQYDDLINQIEAKISIQSGKISKIIEQQNGTLDETRATINNRISTIDKEISALEEDRKNKLSSERLRYDTNKTDIQNKINTRTSALDGRTNEKEIIQSEIEALNTELSLSKKVKRDAAQESQVYRLASLFYGKHDVADVTKDEIKVVSIVWFGSIALIVSTIGTILALISYILRDPEAFVERQKSNFLRYFMKVIRIFFLRLGRLLASLTNLVFALIKLVLSFAEIFKGLVGKPMQRSFRKTMASIRRRMNKPKIVEIEKIVEKEVQVEVEKIVEVEKVVEKIVEKEVPVHKVEIKEVPVEVIRKELVYVPLYSTDTGLIDASTELKGAKPKLDEKK